jgi:flagellar biosynthetic protein FliR
MSSFNIPLPVIEKFLLVFLRTGAIILFTPFFDSRNVPALFKMGFVLSASLLVYPIAHVDTSGFAGGVVSFSAAVCGEILLGVTIGFTVKMMFAGIQMGAQTVGTQIGFAMARTVDPLSNSSVTVLTQLINLAAMLMFFTTDAHHWYFKGLVDSFHLVPVFNVSFETGVAWYIVQLAANIFIIALKVGGPIIAVLLLTSIALGMAARLTPQMNIFIVAFPLKILVGLLALVFAAPMMISFISQIFDGLGNEIMTLLKLIG